jgi:hypothetical protein
MKRSMFEQKLLISLKKVHALPDWMQDILLQDINCAIENRIAIMEMISRKVAGKPA